MVETSSLPIHGPGGAIAVKRRKLRLEEMVEVEKGGTFVRISRDLDALNRSSSQVVGLHSFQQSLPLYTSSYPSAILDEHLRTRVMITPWSSKRFIAPYLSTRSLSPFILTKISDVDAPGPRSDAQLAIAGKGW